jgi:small subunit ribosomal protein S15
MSFTTAVKAQIIKTHRRSKEDTGSSEVQIALLSARIEYLTAHLKIHKHDVHTRYGLTNLVSKRRRLMAYYKRENPVAYRKLLTDLEVRG